MGEKPDPGLAPALEPLPDDAQLTPAQYRKRYAAFEVKEPRFWPEVIADDAKIALIVVVILLALTIVLGVPVEQRADPTDTAYIPRPEWYFLFLFRIAEVLPR